MSSLKESHYVDKLTDENYSVWKFKIEQLLIKEGLYDVVFETKREDDENWDKNDRNARALICLNISDSQIVHVRHSKSAKETYDQLKSVHERVNLTNKLFLLRKLYSIKYVETMKMQEHINSVLELAEKLRSIGEIIQDDNLIAILLCSLPNSYSTFITAIESKNESELSLKYVQNKLIDEYVRRVETKQISTKMESIALKGNTNKPKYFNKQKFCTYCKRNNHTREDCFHLKGRNTNKQKPNFIQDRSQKFKKSNNFSASTASSQNEKLTECSQNKNEKEGSNSSGYVMKSQKENKDKNLNFVIDSGASVHLSNSLELFSELKKSSKETITIANGEKLTAKGKGKCTFNIKTLNGQVNKVTLDNVLYVPDLDSNLLSVQSCTEKGYVVTFKNDICSIKKGNTTVADTKIDDGLYRMKINPVNEKAFNSEILPVCKNVNCILKWHQRLGHRNLESIKKIQRNDLALGITINNCSHNTECSSCIKAKLTEKSFPKQTTYRSKNPLDLIYTDVCGPAETESLGSKRYFVTFIDDFSRCTQVYFISSKDEVFEKLKEFVASTMNKFRMKIKSLRSDNGTEYCNQSVCEYLKNLGINHQTTTPYSPSQNGVAERKNRSLIEMCKAMLINAKLPKTFWAEAIATAAYLQNRLPTKSTEKTPYELWNGHKPNLSHLKVFGCKAYVYVHKQKRRKFDEKATEGIFVGYDLRSKGYRICVDGRKIIVSRTVKFLENMNCDNVLEENLEEEISDLIHFNFSEENVENNHENILIDENTTDEIKTEEISEDSLTSNEVEDNTQRRISNRETKGIPPDRFSYKTEDCHSKHQDPKTFKDVLNLPIKDRTKWFQAMAEEIESLKENDVYELVDLPKDKHAIGCKWIYKTKYDENGEEIKCKARLVAKGFTQKHGTDYDETFSPVVKHTTIRAFLAKAAYHKTKVFQVDIKTAFLHGKLNNEELYMHQPEGFYDEENKDKVYKLKKAIYGLKQAAKCWNEEIENTLKSYGFIQSEADPCMFIKEKSKKTVYLILYVDDMLITSEDENEVYEVINYLKNFYSITSLGEAKYFLGIEIHRKQDGSYLLSQKGKINQLVKDFKLEEAKPTYTPMETNYYSLEKEENLLLSNDNYRQAIGSLLYISSCTRPDITASTHILSRRCNNPRQKDWNAVKRVIRYLNTTKDLKLNISSKEYPNIVGYSDADWGQDATDRKSTSGNIIFLGNSCISWFSRKQTCVSLSSAEAEYVALSQGTQEVLWILKLCKDLNLEQKFPIKIFEDNQSTIKLVESEKFKSRTKHIDTKYHYIRDLKSKNIIDVNYLSTDKMIADIMTKPLPKTKFELCRNLVHLVDSTTKPGRC